jgi:hypothetical protein
VATYLQGYLWPPAAHFTRLQNKQVTLLLRKVRPEWTSENFQTVPFITHGDQQKEGQLRELGQGAFTGKQRRPGCHDQMSTC